MYDSVESCLHDITFCGTTNLVSVEMSTINPHCMSA